MKRQNRQGFTLVELLVTMVIFVVVMVAASNIFLGLLTQFKQQSKIAETNIEGMVGLQMLKADIEQTGYGLLAGYRSDPDGANSDADINYDEASGADAAAVGFDASIFNDSGAPGRPPRPVLTADSLTMAGTSDVLVLKSSNIAINDAAHKFANLANNDGVVTVSEWRRADGSLSTDENLVATDRVIVMDPVEKVSRITGVTLRERILQVRNGAFFTTFNNIAASVFAPIEDGKKYVIYGISGTNNPIMPFNRADYYVRTPAALPAQCYGARAGEANPTGILYKGTINHTAGGGIHTELPLLDCVAAMKIVFMLDADDNPATPPTPSTFGAWPVLAGATPTTSDEVRRRLKEIRIYILLHEGQRDTSYTYTAQGADLALGADHIGLRDPLGGLLLDYTVPDRNYRWKIYTMVITPYNVR